MATARAAIVPVTPFQQNCTLVWSDATKVGAVVDPGGDVDRIKAAIAQVGITIEKILITHGHIDHAGGAAELAEALGVPVEGPHRADAALLDTLPASGLAFGIAGARALTPDRWLEEGDTVAVSDLAFSVLHCPGHSPGSVVLFNEENRFALMGDVLFRGSVGRTDLPGGSHDQLIASIRDKVLPLGDDVAFICGHGPTSTVGEERATNPFIAGA
jgi:glyoxylase-like metal-dependent hydrolase (beta-lactamase superfamily II)